MARILVLGSLADSLVNFRGALLREMVAHGHEVFACAPTASAAVRLALSQMGVIYKDIKLARTGNNPIQDLQTINELVALCRSIRPDFFLGYTIKPVIYGSIAARIAGVPNIFSMITGLGYAFSKHTFKSLMVGSMASGLYRLALRGNRRVFFQNPDDLALFLKKGLIRSHLQAVLINGSGVDIEAFQPAPFPSKLSFLLIARLLRDKGVYEYAEAARKVTDKFPEVRFRLVGWIDPNPYAIHKDDLQAWQQAGIIEYLGRLSDVRPAIADCAVYVLPSYSEGTPRTVLEAMAMGRPIITTDAPGCRETVVEGVNGFLVKVRDTEGLAEACERFIQDPGLIRSMGMKSREIAVNKYDVKKVNKLILETMGLYT